LADFTTWQKLVAALQAYKPQEHDLGLLDRIVGNACVQAGIPVRPMKEAHCWPFEDKDREWAKSLGKHFYHGFKKPL
jgi:hypothetical protein